MYKLIPLFLFVIALFFIPACKKNSNHLVLLELLPSEKTGVEFTNEIREDENLNILSFEYFYNGAGVGIGDFNKDGLQDIFFSSNMGQSKLYLNRGNFVFDDITDSSGINTTGKWASGVSIVDINQDSLPDIYLCFAGPHGPEKRANSLYINNGNSTFTDKAVEYGLADTGHSVQAVFFDYDRDQDLDMYLLTNITDETGPNIIRPKRNNGEMANTDRLYHNNGNNTFTNVSREAGITKEGYGLGVSVADINEDGWPDIFVSNDYISNDLLYINNKNGTFSDVAGVVFKHTSYSAMGNDIGDINNDGKPDLIEVDMLPPDNYRKKMMLGSTNHDRYRSELQYGYDPQFMRNTLQLNRGINENGIPGFSEIGQLSGIAATDWSWSALLADLDNDGWKDLVVTNGYPRDITNRDFITYRAQSGNTDLFAALQKLDGALLHSFVFQNQKNLIYKDVSAEWGISKSAYSSGAAYADLDNDGDQDLILVNTGTPADIYRNNADSLKQHHSISIALKGPPGNIDAFGTKINLYANELALYQEYNPVHGYQSSVAGPIHFGINKESKADSVIITWPDGKITRLYNIKADQQIQIVYSTGNFSNKESGKQDEIIFQRVNKQYNIHFRHKETPYTDFNIQPLLPHKFSQSGPGIAVGDMNGDGMDDFFVGGAYHQSGELFFQQKSGNFISIPLENRKKSEEDMGALLFDADNDKDLDLYVVSGGNEFAAGSKYYQDRLYSNDGHGRFKLNTDALPAENSSGSCVTASDFDRDGDLDLFVAGKINPQHYPEGGNSFLLENRAGRFIDVTDEKAPGLKNIGMVNAAIWSDVNNDHRPDLIVAGEWMPVTVFTNEQQQFRNVTRQFGLENTVGWWNSIHAGDFNRDGRMDFILGNLGSNSRYTTSATNPLTIYTNDFGNVGNRNPVITYKEKGNSYPIHPRDDMMMQLPGLRKKFPLYDDYAKAGITDLFSPQTLQQAKMVTANTFQSVILLNNGNQPWAISPLCVEAQFAPVFGILVNDYDADGFEDILLTGNFYGTEVINGQYDAFKGLFLQGNGQGEFKVKENGFRVEGDGKGLAEILRTNNTSIILAALNNDSLVAVECRSPNKGLRILKASADDAVAIIQLDNGKTIKQEFYYGSGYLSGTARYLRLPGNVKSVELYNYKGVKRKLSF
ncbi:VCBS repeat-containing protein [Terrimonas pollutisoli]|uniref:VCBS repeat-containing protein n=1 Tax=Terrimonas pollutisoli TaxID=3034147 RepID=UPI0023EDE7BF|nr:VCBS repeat-containing protein [Terrimonas sp. H1YJ31]